MKSLLREQFKNQFLGLIGYLLLIAMFSANANADGFSPYVSSKGEIYLPNDIRENLTHMGSWFVPEGDASGFHDVYTEPETITYYRLTGEFPDGATLVKELRHSKSGDYSTGSRVSHSTSEIKQWFVMIKDTKGRFKSNANWGLGWGWALFKPNNPKANISTDYQKDCMGCHVPVKNSDWVFVEGYPTLKQP